MTFIKNIKLISGQLSSEDIATLEAEAAEHFQEYGIEYKILDLDARSFTVLITQAAPPKEKCFSNREFSGISKELFRRFLPNMSVHSRPLAFNPPKNQQGKRRLGQLHACGQRHHL